MAGNSISASNKKNALHRPIGFEQADMMAESADTKTGGYHIPNLILGEKPKQNIFYGKYGNLRRNFLQVHRPQLWMELVNSGHLSCHLKAINQMAE